MRLLQRLFSWFTQETGNGRPHAPAVSFDVEALSRQLGCPITRPELFMEALTHRSHIQIPGNENLNSNERLEFLGDAILNLIVAEDLFRRHGLAHEGDLTKIRSRLVNKKSLNVFARRLHLEEYIFMNLSTNTIGDRGMENLLADAFEAIVAAIYLDAGFQEAKGFVERLVLVALEEGVINMSDENFKSQLLELSQSKGFGIPRYTVLSEIGPDHDRTFTVAVSIRGEQFGTGTGKNKKDAEQAAAATALQSVRSL
jgi:ribonuclease III